jgi:hypothetical protein
MIAKNRVDQARQLLMQARDSATYAHECWGLLITSRKALLNAYREMGLPPSAATAQFKELMNDHINVFRASLAHLDDMTTIYDGMLEHFSSLQHFSKAEE